ncbi:MAG: hypothetical protein ACJ74T_18645 [Pyrinomonadaceae bacterium]
MRFVSAATVSLETFAAAFMSAFEGYAAPVSVDAVWLAHRVRRDLLVLERPAEWKAATKPRGAAPQEAPADEMTMEL